MTHQVITALFKENPSWFNPQQKGRTLSYFLQYYLTQCLSSASVERVMSTHTYLDTGETQGRTGDTRDHMVQLYKELPQEDEFDTETAVQIWAQMVPRRTALPPQNRFPSAEGKHMVKPMRNILAARAHRNKRFLILADPDLNMEDEPDNINQVRQDDQCDSPPHEDTGRVSPPDSDWDEESDRDDMV